MTKKDFELKNKSIFVCGHNGMVGSAILRRLKMERCEVMTVQRKSVDLRDELAVKKWFTLNQPDAVILAAAKVGGILVNDAMPVQFLLDNLKIQNSIITSAFEHNVKKLLFLGSNCIYPVKAKQPISEQCLLTGPLEPTNQWYAVAKIAGIKLCQAYRKQYGSNFITVIPTNLFGPNDNYSSGKSHVIASLSARFFDAVKNDKKIIRVWGSGRPRREFLHVDDLADGLVFLLQNYNHDDPINIGTGEEISIKELALMLKEISGWRGALMFDKSKPDGAYRKIVDNKRIHKLGWKHITNFRTGLSEAYAWYEKNYFRVRN